MSIEEHLPPALPDHSLRAYGATPPTDEQHVQTEARRVVEILQSGETWHAPQDLNAPGYHAIRTGDYDPLRRAISRSRGETPLPRSPFARNVN